MWFHPHWIPSVAPWSSFSSGQINGSVSVSHSLSRSLFLPLWALCSLLFSLMFSPEGGLRNNNSRHDKREHMQPYRPYTLQRITQLPSTHWLTGWRDRGSGPWPAWEEWSEGCMRVWVTVYLLGGGFQSGWEKKKWGRRWRKRRRRRESFNSHCYCPIMMQSTAMRHLKQLTGLTATGWTGTGPITSARLWKTKHRGGGGTVTLTDTLWFKLLTSAILYLQQNVFPIQTMTNCVQYRPNKWIVFVYMEVQQHSWIALTNQAQRGLQCRCFPKERPAAHSG